MCKLPRIPSHVVLFQTRRTRFDSHVLYVPGLSSIRIDYGGTEINEGHKTDLVNLTRTCSPHLKYYFPLVTEGSKYRGGDLLTPGRYGWGSDVPRQLHRGRGSDNNPRIRGPSPLYLSSSPFPSGLVLVEVYLNSFLFGIRVLERLLLFTSHKVPSSLRLS